MVNRLNEIKKLRKTKKVVVEEELIRLEKGLSNGDFENGSKEIAPKMRDIKRKINQLEKDLENLANLEKKFKQKP